MNTSCTAPRPGLCSSSAPEKRQCTRLAVPESDGFFTPEIRPDFGRCSSQSPMSGIGGMRVPRGRAPLVHAVSQTRQFPAPSRFNP